MSPDLLERRDESALIVEQDDDVDSCRSAMPSITGPFVDMAQAVSLRGLPGCAQCGERTRKGVVAVDLTVGQWLCGISKDRQDSNRK